MNTLQRIGAWFGSLLLSVTLFSLLYVLLFSGADFFSFETIVLVFRATMIFALPAWCLYLPVVIALRDAEERRFWTILSSGIAIGPVSLAVWGLFLQLRGGDPEDIWQGDPLLGIDAITTMVFALIVGFLTTSFYLTVLKILRDRSVSIREPIA